MNVPKVPTTHNCTRPDPIRFCRSRSFVTKLKVGFRKIILIFSGKASRLASGKGRIKAGLGE